MEIREQAEKLLKRVNKFILCGIDSDDYPTAKAVLPAKVRGSLKKMLFKGCLLKGEMKVCNDLIVKEKLWKNSYKSAYPNSEKTYHDPDFCVLEFRAIRGRYYSMFKTNDFNI